MTCIKNKLLLTVIFILTECFLYSSELDDICNKIRKDFGDFAFIVTNPQNGKITVSYNDDMIFYTKFSPGSLLKPFAIIGLSKTKDINPAETIYCKGNSDPEISCWRASGHGRLNLIRAIAYSCNYYFYYFLKDSLDKKAYIDTLREFSIFYSDDDFNLKQEDFIKLSFGLGDKYSIYPADLVFAYNALFNGGRIFGRKGELLRKIHINEKIIDILIQGMKECYLYGTTKYILEETKIVDIMAKSGTGLYIDPMNNNKNYNNGWVNLFYPTFNPDFNLMVIVKKGGSSAACRISANLLKHFNKR